MRSLVRQLSETAPEPTDEDVEELIGRGGLLLARLGDATVAGMLTLVLYRSPTGLRARIEDVVVDAGYRGRGIGEELTLTAIHVARERGARTVELTSHPSRKAANALYRKLGFERRETNVYRLALDDR